MTDTQLRWGILSTAHINRSLIPPLKESKRNRLIAVASRDKQKAAAYSSEWKIPKAYGAYEELLSDPEVDVIYNPLPNSLHAAWTVKALEAGKHVLCEKPLATTLDDVDAITAAASKTGKVVAEAFMYRHHPQTLKVKELVKGGAVGKVVMMRGVFTFSLTNLQDIRMNPDLSGGSIWDIGCYPISYARFMYGLEPIQVFGFQVEGPTGVDQSFSGEMRFLGDVVAQFQSSFWSPSYTLFEIFGDKGRIVIPEPFKPGSNEKFYLFQNGNEKEIEVKSGNLYEGEIEDMADAILNNKPPRISLAESRNNVRTILNLLASAKTGAPI